MRKRKGLRFLMILMIMVTSLFNHVFASQHTWICTAEQNSRFAVGETIYKASSIAGMDTHPSSAYCDFDSEFELKAGQKLEFKFGATFDSINYDEEQNNPVSSCGAVVTSESGKVIAKINFILDNNNKVQSESVTTYITNSTAGKVNLSVFIEGTGEGEISTKVNLLSFKVNGVEY